MTWVWFAIGSAVFAGLTAVFGKIGVRDIPSNLATLLRTFVIVPFLLMIVWTRGEWRAPSSIPPKTLTFLVLSGLATGFSWLCYYRALQLGPASLVAPIDKLSLVIAVVLSVAFLSERLRPIQWMGVLLILAGTFLIALKGRGS